MAVLTSCVSPAPQAVTPKLFVGTADDALGERAGAKRRPRRSARATSCRRRRSSRSAMRGCATCRCRPPARSRLGSAGSVTKASLPPVDAQQAVPEDLQQNLLAGTRTRSKCRKGFTTANEVGQGGRLVDPVLMELTDQDVDGQESPLPHWTSPGSGRCRCDRIFARPTRLAKRFILKRSVTSGGITCLLLLGRTLAAVLLHTSDSGERPGAVTHFRVNAPEASGWRAVAVAELGPTRTRAHALQDDVRGAGGAG